MPLSTNTHSFRRSRARRASCWDRSNLSLASAFLLYLVFEITAVVSSVRIIVARLALPEEDINV